jgi:hypothetical protein
VATKDKTLEARSHGDAEKRRREEVCGVCAKSSANSSDPIVDVRKVRLTGPTRDPMKQVHLQCLSFVHAS